VKTPQHDPFIFGSAMERRVAARRNGNPTEVQITDAERQGPLLRGLVLDRSVGGLCLLVDREIGPGTLLGVRPASSADSIPWLDIEVRSCRQTQEGWELGCQFKKTPPWGVILLFG
jgi:hypothetical protein